jgi:hypothetical protein
MAAVFCEISAQIIEVLRTGALVYQPIPEGYRLSNWHFRHFSPRHAGFATPGHLKMMACSGQVAPVANPSFLAPKR